MKKISVMGRNYTLDQTLAEMNSSWVLSIFAKLRTTSAKTSARVNPAKCVRNVRLNNVSISLSKKSKKESVRN